MAGNFPRNPVPPYYCMYCLEKDVETEANKGLETCKINGPGQYEGSVPLAGQVLSKISHKGPGELKITYSISKTENSAVWKVSSSVTGEVEANLDLAKLAGASGKVSGTVGAELQGTSTSDTNGENREITLKPEDLPEGTKIYWAPVADRFTFPAECSTKLALDPVPQKRQRNIQYDIPYGVALIGLQPNGIAKVLL